jgi:hypothetical protein
MVKHSMQEDFDMKKIIVFVGIANLAGLFLLSGVAMASERGAHRQFRQQVRIHQGAMSGDLTRGEIRELEREQLRIRHAKRLAWRDGVLDPWERARLKRMQDRANHHIYRYKHNDVGR